MTIDGEEREAARIVYRLDDTRAYIDGEIREIDSDELRGLEKNGSTSWDPGSTKPS
jgi:hypothetical protein